MKTVSSQGSVGEKQDESVHTLKQPLKENKGNDSQSNYKMRAVNSPAFLQQIVFAVSLQRSSNNQSIN